MTKSVEPNNVVLTAGPNHPVSGLAIAAMILGILGLCFFPFAIAALIIGYIALKQIDDVKRALTGRGMAIAGIVLGWVGVIVIFLALVAGILLPALGGTRRAARQMKNTTQVRGIVQGFVVYASYNKERMPGLDSNGFIKYDLDGPTVNFVPTATTGADVEGRFWLMLDNNAFTSEYIISPSETKTNWTTKNVTTANYFYALLNINDTTNLPTSVTDQKRPNQSGRAREWRQTINPQAVLISDRARISDGRIGVNYDKIYSIHTSKADQKWAGSVGLGDGSAAFENEAALDTKYGSGASIEFDRLFTKEKDSDPGNHNDIVRDPRWKWDWTSNALLGYEGCGYEDPHIASD